MNDPRLNIISEQNSPLFRIMWVTNPLDQARRQFDNNISAFHIGGGLVVSVAHNLRSENPLLKSIPSKVFETELLPLLDQRQKALFSQSYTADELSGMHHIAVNDAAVVKNITDILRVVRFDNRWETLAKRKWSTPHLIIQFSNRDFYNNVNLTRLFNQHNYFFEPTLNRYTFLLPLELQFASYGSDIAVYKITGCGHEVISAIPYVTPSFDIPGDEELKLYCLQSSPAGFLGRLLNEARIEGYLDQYQVFNDRFGGNYVLEGARYLIKGYFRFGSSGAPYLKFNPKEGSFRAVAVQSEASPIQLSINNNREGNYQYVNAIASPMSLVENDLIKLNSIV